ncbi:hypothetical protein [Chondrinema litorale]|uniref:hypothetical protein n=1 Tax=Chondrinema litorale TaxID=2994555 RepID=UPI00254270FA|nr:hypothetical protein [Chondrinema litorale]UZR97681.1 hypothetical protein OQ292_28150 [Chondrinema litorale]
MTQINLTSNKIFLFVKIIFISFILLGCEEDDPEPNNIEVIPVYPPINAENVELGFKFRWKVIKNELELESNNYAQYVLLIGTNPDELVELDTNIFYKTHTESKALDLDTKFYWQIRIKELEKIITESDVFEFSTASSLETLKFPQKQLMVYPQAFIPESVATFYIAPQFEAFDFIDGYSNTQKIIAGYAVADSRMRESFRQVSEFCANLNAYGYDDWYLPAIVEIDSVVSRLNLVDIDENRFEFWSSTEAIYTGDPYYGVYLKSYYTTQDRPYLIVQRSASANDKMRCLCVREVE